MHHRAVDIAGQQSGSLTAVAYAGSDGKKSLWWFRCQCGVQIRRPATEFRKGKLRSCGCQALAALRRPRTHGMTRHPAYAVWASMRARCGRPSHPAYPRYGGRGITVCAAWRDFAAFWRDMGPTYQRGLTLERVDNNRGYEPANCVWAGRQAQASNTRRTRRLSTPWGILPLEEAARRAGIGATTLHYRVTHRCPPARWFDPPNVSNRFSTS